MDFVTKLLSFFQAGGFFMFPIAGVMILTVAVSLERLLFLRRVEGENRGLWKDVQPLLAEGNFGGAEDQVRGSETAIGRILGNGLAQARVDNRRSELEIATEEGLMEVMPALEKRTHYLATFSNLATLLGLLGTVIGLIGAFASLGTADPAEKADLLSASISEAMNCTAFGLMVAIPALLLHSYLQAKTTELVDSLEAVCARFISLATARAKK